jgi:catechol 2,3-dioxygenase-like lactoylglutathione lyase family enzyme
MVHLDMIGIVSRDVKAAAEFYRNLGLDFPEPDGPYVEAVTRGGIRVSINDAEMVKGFYGDVEVGCHSIGLAFLCDSPDHVDSMFADLTAKGYKAKLEPFDAFWGQRYATVLDTDGHAVDLFAPNSPSQNDAEGASE